MEYTSDEATNMWANRNRRLGGRQKDVKGEDQSLALNSGESTKGQGLELGGKLWRKKYFLQQHFKQQKFRSKEAVAIVQTTNGRKGMVGSDWYLDAYISASNLLTKELKYDRSYISFSTTSWFLKACFHMPRNVFCNLVNWTYRHL